MSPIYTLVGMVLGVLIMTFLYREKAIHVSTNIWKLNLGINEIKTSLGSTPEFFAYSTSIYIWIIQFFTTPNLFKDQEFKPNEFLQDLNIQIWDKYENETSSENVRLDDTLKQHLYIYYKNSTWPEEEFIEVKKENGQFSFDNVIDKFNDKFEHDQDYYRHSKLSQKMNNFP